jgi:hypothetical protein
MLRNIAVELDQEAMGQIELAGRLGASPALVKDWLLIMKSQGFVEEIEARPSACGVCPRRERCRGRLWRLTDKGKRAKEEMEREETFAAHPG